MPTGYFRGGAFLAGSEGSFDTILLDELARFNLHDAARLSQCAVVSSTHADPNATEDALGRLDVSARPLLMTDGAFATTGRVAQIAEYGALVQARGGLVFVYESHAYGVGWPNGRGAAELCSAATALHAGTFSKAFCAMGGALPSSGTFAARVRAVHDGPAALRQRRQVPKQFPAGWRIARSAEYQRESQNRSSVRGSHMNLRGPSTARSPDGLLAALHWSTGAIRMNLDDRAVEAHRLDLDAYELLMPHVATLHGQKRLDTFELRGGDFHAAGISHSVNGP